MVFVAHPLSGDIEGNTKKVEAICREILLAGNVPIFPSFETRRYLGDTKEEKLLMGRVIEECLRRSDEVWLYGDHISPGMAEEINCATFGLMGMKVVAKTPETERELAANFLDL